MITETNKVLSVLKGKVITVPHSYPQIAPLSVTPHHGYDILSPVFVNSFWGEDEHDNTCMWRYLFYLRCHVTFSSPRNGPLWRLWRDQLTDIIDSWGSDKVCWYSKHSSLSRDSFEIKRRYGRKFVMASRYNQTMLLCLIVAVGLSSVFAQHVLDTDKIDCYPEIGNQTLCEARGCTWEESLSKVMIFTRWKNYFVTAESGVPWSQLSD